MAFRKNVGKGYGKFWRGVIFDRQYKNLDDLVAKSQKWFPQFNDGAQWKSAPKDYKWVWPTGEELLFRVGSKASDYESYHGHEYPFIGFNELTKQASRKFYDLIKSCNRSSFLPEEHSPDLKNPLPEIPRVIFSTTNPHGPGHTWVKSYFIDKAECGVVVKRVSNVFNPRTKQKENVTRTAVHIFGSYKENRYLSPEYVAELDAIDDPNKRAAWLHGNWDIVAGGALDDVFSRALHVLKRVSIPHSWRIDRAMDWGSTHPFSVGWYAESNGEELTLSDGSTMQTIKGDLFRIAEFYGTKEIGSNDGIKLGPTDLADKTKEIEAALETDGWIESKVRPGPADNQINSKNDSETESIASRMAAQGVRWELSDKSPGSRVIGLELVRERFRNSKTKKGPGLYIFDNCRAALATLPVLPRDEDKPDDVDTEAEDHIYDELRYRVLAGNNRFATKIKVKYAT